MRKGDYCISNIDKLVAEGCIDKKRATELKRWQEFREEHGDMSPLSERACMPLMREKDPEVQAKAIEVTGRQLKHRPSPTADQMKTRLVNIEAGKGLQGGKHLGKAEDKPVVELSDFTNPVEPAPDEAYPYEGEEDADTGDIPVLPDEEEVLGITPEPVIVTPDEEDEEDIEQSNLEVTEKVVKENLRNAGHLDVPKEPKSKLTPTEENKQAIFDKCMLQACVWGMLGDEISRRARKALADVDQEEVEKLQKRLGSEN